MTTKASISTVEITIGLARLSAEHRFSGRVSLRLADSSEGAEGEMELDLAALGQPHDDPERYGERLMGMLLHDTRLKQTWDNWCYHYLKSQLSEMRLFISVESDDYRLHNVAWETLKAPVNGPGMASVALSRSRKIRFARRYVRGQSVEFPAMIVQPRALVVICSPSDSERWHLEPFDVASQLRAVRRAFCWAQMVEFVSGEKGKKPTPDNLTDELRKTYDIICIICHGAVREGMPVLYLENDKGAVEWVTASKLQHAFAEGCKPRLAILSLCHSANSEAAHASLGHTLSSLGIPAVIAVNQAIGADSARDYIEQLGRQIFHGGSVHEAVREARIRPHGSRHWWQPVLFWREDVPLINREQSRAKFAEHLFRQLEQRGKAHCAAVVRHLQSLDLTWRAYDQDPYVFAGSALRDLGEGLDRETARRLTEIVRQPASDLAPIRPELVADRMELRRCHALELSQLLHPNGVADDHTISMLYKVFHQLGQVAPVLDRDIQRWLLRLASLPDDPEVVGDSGSPLRTFATWMQEPPGDRAPDEALQRALGQWVQGFDSAMGWAARAIPVPPLPAPAPEPCLYVTIRLLVDHHAFEEASANVEVPLSAMAWLWCSDLPNAVPIDLGRTSYTLDADNLASLFKSVLGQINHVVKAYGDNLVVEWVVPWQLLDWGFGQKIRFPQFPGDAPLGTVYRLVTRLDHSLYVPSLPFSFCHHRRFDQERFIPIRPDEVRIWPDVPAMMGASVDGEPALGVVLSSTLRLFSTRSPAKALQALQVLRRAKAAIVLWRRADERRRSGRGEVASDALEQYIVGQMPAQPPIALTRRQDIVLVWDDLKRLPPCGPLQSPGLV